jgi:hypothetical protein
LLSDTFSANERYYKNPPSVSPIMMEQGVCSQ